jgi:hypothetical protein
MSKGERFSRGNLIFLFVVAFLMGVIVKQAVGNNVRIGYDDPTTIIKHGELYDIDKLEQKILKKGIPEDISSLGNQEVDG